MMQKFFFMIAVISLTFAAGGGELAISSTLDQARTLRGRGEMDASIAVLIQELRNVIATQDKESDAVETAQRALDDAEKMPDLSRKQARLYYGLEEVKTALNFKPVVEAPLPDGFPPPGEVGKIVVKEYPAYRAARTPMQTPNDDNSAFGKLFQHITSNNVKMTAPVEMTYENETGSPVSMAFLYEQPNLGAIRQEGEVEVVDLPKVMVVSIGVRGNYSEANREKATAKLKAWIESHGNEYEIAGPSRVMGYNSPFVMPILRFSEVQIPVTKK